MRISRLSADAAHCEPIVLRDGIFTRLVFKPTLVRNQEDDTKPVLGEFVYQKKKKADEWEDLVDSAINDMNAGSGVRLKLSPSEIDSLLKYVCSLYDFYGDFKIPGMVRDVEIGGMSPPLGSDAATSIRQILEKHGTKNLGAILTWASETADSADVVKELQRLDASSLQQISTLAGVGSLKNALELWELEKGNNSEDFWQKQLSANPFLLSQVFASPVIFLEEKPYVGGKSVKGKGGGYPDFLLQSIKTGNVLIVEIKEPTTSLLGGVYRPPHVYSPSKEISGAVVQVARYKEKLLKNYGILVSESDIEFKAISPQCLIVAGNTDELDNRGKLESFESFRRNLSECSLITYDELFGKTANLVDLLEGAVERKMPF